MSHVFKYSNTNKLLTFLRNTVKIYNGLIKIETLIIIINVNYALIENGKHSCGRHE